MKKTILSLITALAVTSSINAQEIPNNGFETWDTPLIAVGSDMEIPTGWVPISNTIALPFIGSTDAPLSVTKATSGRTGSAIKIETVSHENNFYPGIAISGPFPTSITTLDPETYIGGFAYTESPSTFNGFYQYTSVGSDAAVIFAALTVENGNTTDTIARATFTTSLSVSEFTEFSVPFEYVNNNIVPDKATIVIRSSGTDPQVGSTLLVDDLSFEGTFTNTFKPLFSTFTKAYPNPAKDILNLTEIPSSASTIEVRDISGRVIDALNSSATITLNVSNYPQGIYFYTVKNANGELLYKDRFSVVK